MRVSRISARVLLLSVPLLAVAFFTSEPVRGIDLGSSRLVTTETFSTAMSDSCTWETAAPAPVAFQQPGGAAVRGAAGGDPRVAARTPLTTIRDP
jgi:hypothetical protein